MTDNSSLLENWTDSLKTRLFEHLELALPAGGGTVPQAGDPFLQPCLFKT